MSERISRYLWPIVWAVIGLVALVVYIVMNETASEVALGTLRTLFGLVTTPFIFEATVAMSFIVALFLFNHWRMKKEGDGWVYLVSQEPEAGKDANPLPPSITQRLQSVVLQDKPEAMDEAGTTRAKIEGFLELGMAAQAAEALEESGDLPDDMATAALRVRVLAANLGTMDAQELLRVSTARFPGHHALFAQTALDCADWLEAHAPQQQETVVLWHDEVRKITH